MLRQMAIAMESSRSSCTNEDPVAQTEESSAQKSSLSRSIIFQMLSSDDDSDSGDDAATTMGSPLKSPWLQAANEQNARREGLWMQSKNPTSERTCEDSISSHKRIEDVFAATPRTVTEPVTVEDDEEDDTFDGSDTFPLISQQSEVMLSPASQLHVLSQISEMAGLRAAREREATAAATSSSTSRPKRPVHAWASAAQRGQSQRQQDQEDAQPKTNAKTKKRKSVERVPATKKLRKSTQGVSARLVADMANWDSFGEPIFAGEDADEDAWSFEELSDSDF